MFMVLSDILIIGLQISGKKSVSLYYNLKTRSIMNHLGLPSKETKKNIDLLNELLANFQVYYQNLRGVHWNIRGKRFFDLHMKFEELYNNAQLRVDEIAERILTLGGTPLHTFADYLDLNKIKVGKNISADEEAVNLVIESLQGLLKLERILLQTSDEINDEGTNSMISDLITEQEKDIWMLQAFLG